MRGQRNAALGIFESSNGEKREKYISSAGVSIGGGSRNENIENVEENKAELKAGEKWRISLSATEEMRVCRAHGSDSSSRQPLSQRNISELRNIESVS